MSPPPQKVGMYLKHTRFHPVGHMVHRAETDGDSPFGM